MKILHSLLLLLFISTPLFAQEEGLIDPKSVIIASQDMALERSKQEERAILNSVVITCQASASPKKTDPLYIMDGKILKQNKIGDIKPEDIESITVLKGVKAIAIYGTRGANGVVIIYTKGWKKEQEALQRGTHSEVTETKEAAKSNALEGVVVFPNPASEVLKCRFSLESPQEVKALIYDSKGTLLVKTFEERLGAGNHEKSWDCSELGTGVYFLRLVTGSEVEVTPFMVR